MICACVQLRKSNFGTLAELESGDDIISSTASDLFALGLLANEMTNGI